MDFLQNLVSFIIVIGVLVFVHELGHFLAALWTGMRADVFALGMGPRVLGWNKINGFSFGKLSDDVQSQLGVHTDYRLCALPIGGYVKILGMVDESMDNDFTSKEPQPYEFRSKGALARAFVLSAGVIMNLLLALVFFWTIFVVYGREDVVTSTVGYVQQGSLADSLGFRSGDKISSINGEVLSEWGSIYEQLVSIDKTEDRKVVVNRNGSQILIPVPAARIIGAIAERRDIGLYPDGIAVKIAGVMASSPAASAKLAAGDIVVDVNGVRVAAVTQLQSVIKSRAGSALVMNVQRGQQVVLVTVNVPQRGPIGVQLQADFTGKRTKVTYAPLTAASMAWERTIGTISAFISSVAHVIEGTLTVKQTFGGPIRIAQMAGEQSTLGLDAFLGFMAGLSVSLAVINLLPLPGLDGGHLVFVGIEAIIRREVPTSIKIRVQQVGMTLLLALMAYIFYLDLTR
jgi:regulator of sigma E protease